MATDERVEEHRAAHEHAHPGPAEYIKVALALGVVTLIEVGAYYVTSIPDVVLVVSLMVMMLVKFALVALWFMHLRFDSPIFRHLFITGIVLAIAIYAVVLLSFGLLL